jgi:hypothetical protein
LRTSFNSNQWSCLYPILILTLLYLITPNRPFFLILTEKYVLSSLQYFVHIYDMFPLCSCYWFRKRGKCWQLKYSIEHIRLLIYFSLFKYLVTETIHLSPLHCFLAGALDKFNFHQPFNLYSVLSKNTRSLKMITNKK